MSIYNPNGKKLNHIVIIKKLLGMRIQNYALFKRCTRIVLKKIIPPQLKRIALILENVSKLFVSNFVYVSLTN